MAYVHPFSLYLSRLEPLVVVKSSDCTIQRVNIQEDRCHIPDVQATHEDQKTVPSELDYNRWIFPSS